MSATTCTHPEFDAIADVHRIFEKDTSDADGSMPDYFNVDLQVRCRRCKVRFRFVGVPNGLSRTNPRSSIGDFELRAPIEPDAHLTSLMAGDSLLRWPA